MMQATYAYKEMLTARSVFIKAINVLASASLSVVVTGGLLLFMCLLIAMDPPEIVATQPHAINVVMPEERKIEEEINSVIEKPVDAQTPPPQLTIAKIFEPSDSGVIDVVPEPVIDGPTITSGSASGTAIAMFQIAPAYPRRALSRNIEGFVDLIFDITPAGKTENIRIIYAEPEGYFENESIRTLAKWKYKPAMDDGIPREQKNQTTRITYELKD